MSDVALAARVRGLASRRALDVPATPHLAEEAIRARTAGELRLLARWADDPQTLATIFLDEDRRTLRAVARGLVANAPPASRIADTIATPTLTRRRIEATAHARTFAELASALGDHPLAPAFAGSDLFAVENALVHRYFELARSGDSALATHVAQLADTENASAALLLAACGRELAPADVFVPKGRRLDRATFVAACRDTERTVLARAFAGTPLASALFSANPSALEDAALAWQLATQARLRRLDPLGLAGVVWFVLHRRADARRVRRATWALGGAA